MALPNHLYKAINTKFGRRDLPQIKVGDTVRVHQKVQEGKKERVQIFEGLVIAVKHGRGLNGSFTVRKIAVGGVAVERVFPLHMPSIVKLERVKTAKVRRSKLYYMRNRSGKGARFTTEKGVNESWQEVLDEEVGEKGEKEIRNEEKADK